MPPKVFNAQGKRDIKAENVEKKGGDGPPIMPSKRMNPMHEERTGQQKPPSRVLTKTNPTPTIPPPLLRSKIAQTVTKQPASRLAYGLTRDKQKEKGELEGVTPVAALPPAPELDTQWVQLRRLQGKWIKGPHGDLLQADGVGSGVTEPFFFSAVRPGSSANKRASSWFGNTVDPLLQTKTVVDLGESSLKRRPSAVGDDKVPMGASATIDPNATSTKALKSTGKKKVKNPNPTNLKEYIAFVFGGNHPQSIYQGTPSVVREFHAQCFPFVRADGLVEISTIAREVIAPMSPTTSDVIEIATHWLELEAERDRAAILNAANNHNQQQQQDPSPLASPGMTKDNDQQQNTNDGGTSEGGVSFPASGFTSVSRNNNQQFLNTDSLAPPGFIQYSSLLEAVTKLLSSEHSIDLAYDLADVCSDGIVNKDAIKRAIAARQTAGKSEESYITVGGHSNTNVDDTPAATLKSVNATAAALLMNNNNNNNNNNNRKSPPQSNLNARTTPDDGGAARNESNSVSRAQTPTFVSPASSPRKRNETTNTNQRRSYSRQSGVSATTLHSGGTTTTTTTGVTTNIQNNKNQTSQQQQQQQQQSFRSLPQLYQDLRAEREEYQFVRAAEHPELTEDIFVEDIIKSTTLGHHDRTQEREPSPPGRYWVTKNPKVVEKLVMSKHFQFNISSAIMRAFSHITNFEQHRAFFPKAKIGKKPKKNAQLPSMRQEHIRRSEFGEIFVSDPHVATPFLPFLMRCSLSELDQGLIAAMTNDRNDDNVNESTSKPTSPSTMRENRY